jgi:GNAT superfamily N-acetyltransferase
VTIEYKDLTPDRAYDLLGFFEGAAFADNPHWATCYCYAYQFKGAGGEWEKRSGAANRKAKEELIRQGRAHGVLAYEGDAVVGWCHAGPWLTVPAIWEESEEVERSRHATTAAIVCFVVPPDRRSQGLAAGLLVAAEDAMRRLGMTELQGYPLTQPAEANERLSSDARNYHGTLSMFQRAGYEEIREDGPFTAVLKKLI